MKDKKILEKTAARIRTSFYVLLLVTAYELWYWLQHGRGLTFILVLLSGAITFFAYSLMILTDNIKDD